VVSDLVIVVARAMIFDFYTVIEEVICLFVDLILNLKLVFIDPDRLRLVESIAEIGVLR